MPALMRAGWFVCNVTQWGVREGKDGSQALSVTMKLVTAGEWSPTAGENGTGGWVETPECDVFADVYVVKKDGQPNPTGVDSLTKARIWDAGEGFMRFANDVWDGVQVVAQVEPNVYQGKTTYRAAWIYPPEHIPGAGGIANRATKERLAELQARAGAMLRALAPPAAVVPKQPTLPLTMPTGAGHAADDTPY